MTRRAVNLERMRRAAERMDAQRTEFLADRAERIEEVIATAEVESRTSVNEFIRRMRNFDERSRDSH